MTDSEICKELAMDLSTMLANLETEYAEVVLSWLEPYWHLKLKQHNGIWVGTWLDELVYSVVEKAHNDIGLT